MLQATPEAAEWSSADGWESFNTGRVLVRSHTDTSFLAPVYCCMAHGSLEHAAQVLQLAKQAGQPVRLSPAQLRALTPAQVRSLLQALTPSRRKVKCHVRRYAPLKPASSAKLMPCACCCST